MKNLYIPDNLNISQILRNNGYSRKYEDRFCYLPHLIYEQRVLYKIKDEFVPLKSSYLRSIISQRYESYRNLLIDEGIIECDGYYIKGRKSYGYKFSSKYSRQRHKKIELKDKVIIENLSRWKNRRLPSDKIYKQLYDFLSRVDIDEQALSYIEDFDIEEYNAAKIAIDKFLEKDFYLYKDDYGRVHTNITSLKSSLRKFLSFEDKKLVNVDIINSQPLMLLLTNPFVEFAENTLQQGFKEGLDVFTYKSLVENGSLYDYMMKELKVGRRKEFKERFFKEIFFGKDVSPYFRQAFPSVAKLLMEIKKTDYRNLAWMMQRAEADIIINRICRQIMSKFPDLFIATIHDSILTVEEGVDRVMSIISDEFRKIGLVPSIRVEIDD